MEQTAEFKHWYDRLREDKAKVLSKNTPEERKHIEDTILKKLEQNMSMHKGKFFTWNQLLDIELVKQYFNVITAQGDRNIGKTYSARRYCESEVRKGKEFMWLRTNQQEAELSMEAEQYSWFNEEHNKWTIESKKTGVILKREEDFSLKPVGHFKSLYEISKYKGIEFKNVETIIYDEFNSDVIIRNKKEAFIRSIITIQRHKPNFKIFLISNYEDENDELLELMGRPITDKKPLLVFDWIIGSIIWYIPAGHYKSFADDGSNIGHRASLKDPVSYQNQFGGSYKHTTSYQQVSLDALENKFEYLYTFVPLHTLPNGKPVNVYKTRKDTRSKVGMIKVLYLTTTELHDMRVQTPIHILCAESQLLDYPYGRIIDPNASVLYANNLMQGRIVSDSKACLDVFNASVKYLLGKRDLDPLLEMECI